MSRLYSCEFCFSETRVISVLVAHERMHADYECAECNVRFLSGYHLAEHNRRDHGEIRAMRMVYYGRRVGGGQNYLVNSILILR